MSRTLEECAEVVLRKWPHTIPCPLRHTSTGDMVWCKNCDSEGEAPLPVSEFLADDGRPSKWLWALWLEHGLDLHNPNPLHPDYVAFVADSGRHCSGDGDTATEAITRALCALAEAS